MCDLEKKFKHADALKYLRLGLERGAVSELSVSGWPKNVWSVTEDGMPLEAQLDQTGSYHGYPMPLEDPMAIQVRKYWAQND